jgi:hypothetical protein
MASNNSGIDDLMLNKKIIEIESTIKNIETKTDESLDKYLGSLEDFISKYTEELGGYLEYLKKQQSSIDATLGELGKTVADICGNKPLSISTELKLADSSKSLQVYSDKIDGEIKVISFILDELSSIYGTVYDTIADSIEFTNKKETEETNTDSSEKVEFNIETEEELPEETVEALNNFYNNLELAYGSENSEETDDAKLLSELEEKIMNSKKNKNNSEYLTKDDLRKIIFRQ